MKKATYFGLSGKATSAAHDEHLYRIQHISSNVDCKAPSLPLSAPLARRLAQNRRRRPRSAGKRRKPSKYSVAMQNQRMLMMEAEAKEDSLGGAQLEPRLQIVPLNQNRAFFEDAPRALNGQLQIKESVLSARRRLKKGSDTASTPAVSKFAYEKLKTEKRQQELSEKIQLFGMNGLEVSLRTLKIYDNFVKMLSTIPQENRVNILQMTIADANLPPDDDSSS